MNKLDLFRNSVPLGVLLGSALLAATAFAADPPRPAGIVDIAGLLGRLNGGQSAIEINQTRALAGGITDGDEPGFPVTISQSGSYILTGNLQVDDPNTTAIRIDVGSVELDLNGFAIEGPALCELRADKGAVCVRQGNGYGVIVDKQRTSDGAPLLGGRIHGGSIRGMGSAGISAGSVGGLGWIVSAVTAVGNSGPGLEVISGTVENSVAVGNGGDGIVSYRSSLVRNNQVHSNGGNGIQALSSSVSGNVVSENGQAGILSTDSLIQDNTVVANFGGGVISMGGDSILNNQLNNNSKSQLTLAVPGSWGGNSLRGQDSLEFPLLRFPSIGLDGGFDALPINQVLPNTCNGKACAGNDFGPIPF